MVWGRKQGNAQSTTSEIENILGASSHVRGDLKSDRGFRIDGTIEGSVESKGPVVIGESGHVQGNISATDVIVVGRVDGNVTATGHLDIGTTGRVVGDVAARSMRIETGGVLQGMSSMGDGAAQSEEEPSSPQPEAPVPN